MDFNSMKILSTDGLDSDGINLLKDSGLQVIEEKLSRSELMTKLSDFDVIIIRSATTLDGEIIKEVSGRKDNKLKIIARAGTGTDNIDLPVATECGILVLNTPTANTISAVEHTLGLICCLSRNIPQAAMSMKNGKWDRKSFMGTELYGKVLAILGLGRIGREVAVRAQAFGMKTIGYDPIVGKDEAASFNVEFFSLEEIWPIADYVTIHVPLLPQTENLINLDVFKKCKPSVKVINCSRGGIVNENDLLVALNTGLCNGAALDVFTEEPPVFGDLLKHPKLIATPHLGASTKEAQFRVSMEIAENLVSIANSNQFRGLVNGQVMNLVHHKEADSWRLLLSILNEHLIDQKRIELFYDDVTNFSKQRGFKDFIKGCLTILLLKDLKNVNLINAATVGKENDLDICLIKRQTNKPLNTPSLGIEIKRKMLEMSVWKNNVYMTKYDNLELTQPVLLQKNSNILITKQSKTSLDIMAHKDIEISALSVTEDLHIFVTKRIMKIDNLENLEFFESL